jgi:alpha-D-xyloside xylohydrolase
LGTRARIQLEAAAIRSCWRRPFPAGPMAAAAALALLFSLAQPSAAAFVVQLDAHGDHSIRVRVAPAGGKIVDPPVMALTPTSPPLSTLTRREGANTLTNGNLKVRVDPTSGCVTATRVSDGKVLLTQTSLTFSKPTNHANGKLLEGVRPGSVATTATFKSDPAEKIYGLGEHRTGTVARKPYSKIFAESQLYAKSHGSDAQIPWYASSEGYGFVWNLPSYGAINITDSAIEWASDTSLNEDIWITTTNVTTPPEGSPYAQLMHRYVDAVGHAARMPFYSTGFIQCKDRYRNQSQVLDVARGYVRRAETDGHMATRVPSEIAT